MEDKSLEEEIVSQLYLAGMPLEPVKLKAHTVFVNSLVKQQAGLGITLTNSQAVSVLVNCLRIRSATVSFGSSVEKAGEAFKGLSEPMTCDLVSSPKKKNWKAKTIWDRVGC